MLISGYINSIGPTQVVPQTLAYEPQARLIASRLVFPPNVGEQHKSKGPGSASRSLNCSLTKFVTERAL